MRRYALYWVPVLVVVVVDSKHMPMQHTQNIYSTLLSMHTYQFMMHDGLCMFTHVHESGCVECMFPPTCAALDGSDGGGGTRGCVGPPDARLLLFLRAAFLDGTHVAVAAHAEAARYGQVQGIHRLRLHFTEHWLTHSLDLPVHLHLTHLWREDTHADIQYVHAKIQMENKHTREAAYMPGNRGK